MESSVFWRGVGHLNQHHLSVLDSASGAFEVAPSIRACCACRGRWTPHE